MAQKAPRTPPTIPIVCGLLLLSGGEVGEVQFAVQVGVMVLELVIGGEELGLYPYLFWEGSGVSVRCRVNVGEREGGGNSRVAARVRRVDWR
jgi:hypothetical protein